MCHAYLNGDYAEALALAQRFLQLAGASAQPWDRLVGERIAGITYLCLGQLADSRAALERMLAGHPHGAPRSQRIRFLYDEKMLAHTALALTVYLQGYPEQAMRLALRAQADAEALAHVPSLCFALSEGVCVMALLAGDSVALAAASAQLDGATRAHGVSTWKARARMWMALPPLLQGQLDAYDQVIAPALAQIGAARYFISLTPLLTCIALALGEHGRVDDGLALVLPAVAQARRSGDASSLVELMRAQALLLLMRGEAEHGAAEQLLLAALDSAQRHGFLSWELRCALALAHYWQGRGRPGACAALRAVHARCSEGHDGADLRAATLLLARHEP